MSKKWPALVKGDIIDIIAPGYSVEESIVDHSILA